MRWFVYPYMVVGIVLMTMPAVAIEIPNGSFEDTSAGGDDWVTLVQDWDMIPVQTTATPMRVGLFQTFDGVNPTAGDYFAIVTNRLFIDMSITSAQITVPDIGGASIAFDYIYATSWGTGTDIDHLDPFTVTITDVDTGQSTSYFIADNYDEDLAAGSLITRPFEGYDPFYDTGWQPYEIDVSNLVGSDIEVTFRIYDQPGGMSAIFLDNVRITPEPGTLALFGAGLVGLTLFGRRKLKLKKK